VVLASLAAVAPEQQAVAFSSTLVSLAVAASEQQAVAFPSTLASLAVAAPEQQAVVFPSTLAGCAVAASEQHAAAVFCPEAEQEAVAEPEHCPDTWDTDNTDTINNPTNILIFLFMVLSFLTSKQDTIYTTSTPVRTTRIMGTLEFIL
jgi:hypothetical protein